MIKAYRYNKKPNSINATVLCFFLSADAIESLVRALLYPMGIERSFFVSAIDVSVYGLALCYLFFSVIFVYEGIISFKRFALIVVVLVLLICLLVLSYYNNPALMDLDGVVKNLIVSYLFFFVGTLDYDTQLFFRRMLFMSPFVLVYGILSLVKYSLAEVYLNIGYNIIPFIIVSFVCFFDYKRTEGLLIGIPLFVVLIASGGRMPLIGVLLFFMLYFFFSSSIKIEYLRIVLCLVVIAIFGGLVISQIGIINSRSLNMFLNGTFFTLSGREGLYSPLLVEVLSDPLKFRGFYGDRFMLYDLWEKGLIKMNLNPDAPYTAYAHNIFIELLCDYGAFIGLLLCVLLIILVIRSLNRVFNGKDSERSFRIFLISIAFFPLLISGSYLIKNVFWLFLGFEISRGIVHRYNETA